MNIKTILTAFMAGTFALSSVALADNMAGTVVAVTPTLITVQRGKDVWNIKCGAGTHTTVKGELKVGASVSISYDAPDAQKKEEPMTAPTDAPAGS